MEVTPGSLLHGAMRRRRARVNSFHHQGINRLGSGLRAVAWSPDGVIEGVEAPARPFVLAVQWHAETLTARPETVGLFNALVEASARGDRLELAA